MKLCVSFQKNLFSREELPVFIDCVYLGNVRCGKEESFSLADAEHCFLQLGDKVTSELSVLVSESDEVKITVKRHKKMLSMDLSGGVLRTCPIGRLLHALNDETAIDSLCEWERNAFLAMLYAELDREDAILESPFVREICDALVAVGDREVGERLRAVLDACELSLPLSPMAKLTPAEESALVESYHQLWTAAENAPSGERERSRKAVMEYVYQMQSKPSKEG